MSEQLFGSDEVPGPATSPPTLIVTNRSNLLDFLSSGLLRPRSAMVKYHPDTLELVNGVVPVVSAPAAAELTELSTEHPTRFPVIVEVDPEAVRPTKDARIGFLQVAALDAVRRVHLATVEDREELTARRFDNVDWSRLEYHVTPALFTGGDVTTNDLRQALGAEKPRVTPRLFELEDRLGGGRLLALHAAPRDPIRVEHIARLAFEAPRKRGRRKTTALADWLRLDESLAVYRPVKVAGYDERLFLAAAAVCLASRRTDSWDGLRLVDEIDRHLDADANLRQDDLARWRKAAERMRAILNATQAFRGFDAREYSTEAAVLLAALRGGVADVLGWKAEPIGGDPWNVTVAALLIGLVHGRTVIGMAFRDRPLDESLAMLERDRLIGSTDKRTVDVVVGASASHEPLLFVDVDRRRVLSVAQEAPSTTEIVGRLDFEDPSTLGRLLEIAAEQGWDDAVKTTIRFKGSFDHQPVASGSMITVHGAPVITHELERDAFLERAQRDASESLRERLASVEQATPPAPATDPSPPAGEV
jgi:hypothetical protein